MSATVNLTRLFCRRTDGTHTLWCGARADSTQTHGHVRHDGNPGTCAGCHAEHFGAEPLPDPVAVPR